MRRHQCRALSSGAVVQSCRPALCWLCGARAVYWCGQCCWHGLRVCVLWLALRASVCWDGGGQCVQTLVMGGAHLDLLCIAGQDWAHCMYPYHSHESAAAAGVERPMLLG